MQHKQWEAMPGLSVARECHASCTSLGGSAVYVFCGFDSQGQCLDSIEQLQEGASCWDFIGIAAGVLTPRAMPAVSALSSSEIVVMGGRDSVSYLGDVIIINLEK